MEIRDKLYKYSNPIIAKTINIDDSIYNKFKDLSEKVYDATISEIINVAIEEYIKRDRPNFYGKTEKETVKQPEPTAKAVPFKGTAFAFILPRIDAARPVHAMAPSG